jgi:LmbE family N-acetylglucosaminyl deacetylase
MFDAHMIQQTRQEVGRAQEVLGTSRTIFLEGFPAAMLDTVPHSRLNSSISDELEEVQPDILFIPFHGDLHRDHRLVSESALVAARPNSSNLPRAIYAYETLSETNWNAAHQAGAFVPNTYLDISPFLDRKIEAMGKYEMQLKPFPHERSLEALQALARSRGAAVRFKAAEAFMLLRAVDPVDR